MGAAALLAANLCVPAGAEGVTPGELQQLYSSRVERRYDVPPADAARYARLVQAALDAAAVALDGPQYIVAVDRSGWVQAAFVFWRSAQGEWRLVGASPVSTGRPGTFDHFETPLGVFEHSPANMDFRAEGTFNENGIRGYGLKGMRVFDFGWQQVPKGWGDGLAIQMRLQMHATDPDALEQRLGTAQSKGCVRIPAALNTLLDHYGVIDADYEALAATGAHLWVLAEDREPVADAGRWFVVIDSAGDARPDWATAPWLPHRRPPAH